MKRSARPAGGILAVLLGVVALSGCSGDDVTTTTTTAVTSTTTLPPEPEEPERTDETDPTATSELPPASGTWVWVHHEEPEDLHVDDPATRSEAAAWIRAALWEGLFTAGDDDELVPQLLAEDPVPEVAGDGSMTVRFTLRNGLGWSDGEPLVADHVARSLAIVLAEREPEEAEEAEGEQGSPPEFVYPMTDRSAYVDIVDVEVHDDLQLSVTWSQPVGAWRTLLPAVFPTHLFDDDPEIAADELSDAVRAWTFDGAALPSSGPLVLESWSRGVNMRLTRNDTYHGPGLASIEAVLVRFVDTPEVAAEQVMAGEADAAVLPGPAPQEEMEGLVAAQLADTSSLLLEIDTNGPHLADREVRRALAIAMGRQALGALAGTVSSGSVVWLLDQPSYVDLGEETGLGSGNTARAADVLRDTGYLADDEGRLFHFERGYLEVSLAGSAHVAPEVVERVANQWRVLGATVVVPEPGSEEESVPGATLVTVARDLWPGSVLPGSLGDRCRREVTSEASTACFDDLDRRLAGVSPGDPAGLTLVPVGQGARHWLSSTVGVTAPVPVSLSWRAGPLVGAVEVVVSR